MYDEKWSLKYNHKGLWFTLKGVKDEDENYSLG